MEIEIDLEDDLLWELFMLAHKRDISLNQLINSILEEYLRKEEDLLIKPDGYMPCMPEPSENEPLSVEPRSNKTFSIDSNYLDELEDWKEKIIDLFGREGSLTYCFTPGAIGTSIKVVSGLIEKPLDLSHTEDW